MVMWDGDKGSGEDGYTSKGPGDDAQRSHPRNAPVWEKNMGDNKHDDEGPGRFSP